MNDKEAFEAKAKELGLMLDRSDVRSDWYAYSETQMAWQCWQAARAYIADPMEDDAAAFRLALLLNIAVWRDDDLIRVGTLCEAFVPGADVAAIARRLIVRAASMCGKPPMDKEFDQAEGSVDEPLFLHFAPSSDQFATISKEGELTYFDEQKCRNESENVGDGALWARLVLLVMLRERDHAAGLVDHILREGGGTWGDAVRLGPNARLTGPKRPLQEHVNGTE